MLKKSLIRTVEPIAYAVVFLLLMRRIIGGGLISLEDLTFEKTVHEMVLWVLLTVIFLGIAFNKSIGRKLISAWRKNWILLIFILFALCSIAWSLNKDASIYKGITLVCCSTIAAYTGLTYSTKIVFRGFWWLFISLTVAIFAVALIFPAAGTHIGYPYYGAWRGIFWSKNYMGPIMAVGNLVFLFCMIELGKKLLSLLGNLIFYFLTALLVFLSKCATAIIILIILNIAFILVVAWVKWNKRLKKVHYIGLAVVFVIILIIISLNLDFLFGLLNRNTTLTGRLSLWSYLIQNGIANHPVLGYGFGATWETNNFRSTTQAAVKWEAPPLVSDNGLIDIFLDLGLIGVVLSISAILLGVYRVTRYAIKEQTVLSFFPAFLMLFVIIVNITLSFFLNLEYFAWFLMVFALFSATPFSPGTNVINN